MVPSPHNARGWLSALLPLLERANSITLLFVLLLGGGVVWHLLGQITLERDRATRLGQWLLEEKAAHLALALQCGRHERPEER